MTRFFIIKTCIIDDYYGNPLVLLQDTEVVIYQVGDSWIKRDGIDYTERSHACVLAVQGNTHIIHEDQWERAKDSFLVKPKYEKNNF